MRILLCMLLMLHSFPSGTMPGGPAEVTATSDPVVLSLPDDGLARVPFRRGIDHVLVEALDAQGRKRTYIIDTGASYSVVAADTAPEPTEPAEDPVDDRSSAIAVGAHGRISTARFAELENLRIGDLHIQRAGAVVLDLSPLSDRFGTRIHGILGFNILSAMITLIDYPQLEIIFVDQRRGRAALAGFGPADHVLPFSLRLGALIEVRGRVNDRPDIPFVVDVGSRFTVLDPAATRDTGIDLEETGESAGVTGLGGRAELQTRRGRVGSLRFGTLTFENAPVVEIDLPVFRTLEADRIGLLGNDLLGGYRVLIDYERAELKLWRPRGEPSDSR